MDVKFQLPSLLDLARTPVPSQYIGWMGTDASDAEIASATGSGAIFTGAAGDQLFYEFQRDWPAADYLRLRGIDRHLLAATLDAAHLGRVSFWRALRDAFFNRHRRGDPLEGAARFTSMVRKEAVEAAGRTGRKYIHPGCFDAADLPIGKFHQLCALVCPVDYYNLNLRDAAPEVVHPLLSQPLLELSLKTPSFALTYGGRGRALARAAFANRIPREVAVRRSKGAASQFAFEVLNRNTPFAREMLLGGQLLKLGFLDERKVEAALSGDPSSRSRVGEIHAYIATEAWLRCMAPR